MAIENHHSTLDTVSFGFWLYIMSDCVLFASLFATFAVLRGETFGGPSAVDIFSLPFVLKETLILLTSSFTMGLAMLAIYRRTPKAAQFALLVTLILGASFLALELSEFRDLVREGFGPQRSAFLSAFFTLVGTHGAHVFVGSIWMLLLMVRIAIQGITLSNTRKLLCLSLFWHFLDVIWIFIFTFVYLFGLTI